MCCGGGPQAHARTAVASERQCLGRKAADVLKTALTGAGITRCWAELHDSGLRAAPLPATRGLREMPAGPGSSSRRRRRRRLASFASSCCLAPWARAPGIYVRGRGRGCPMRRLLSSLWLLCLPEWYLLWLRGSTPYFGHTDSGSGLTLTVVMRTMARLAREVESAAAAARLLGVEEAVGSRRAPRSAPSTPHRCLARCRLTRHP